MEPIQVLILIALGLVVLAFFKPAWPLVPIAVLLIASYLLAR